MTDLQEKVSGDLIESQRLLQDEPRVRGGFPLVQSLGQRGVTADIGFEAGLEGVGNQRWIGAALSQLAATN